MSVGDSVEKLLPHGADVAEVMMPGQETAGAGAGFGRGEKLELHLRQWDGDRSLGSSKRFRHGRSLKNSGRHVQPNAPTHLPTLTCHARGIFRASGSPFMHTNDIQLGLGDAQQAPSRDKTRFAARAGNPAPADSATNGCVWIAITKAVPAVLWKVNN